MPRARYQAGDFIGRTGVEAAWESYLRGHNGELTRQGRRARPRVDARGVHEPDAETRREPMPGRDLRLTLDMDLMKVVERAFRGHPSGAAVVVDVHTGRVRALFSKPSYDLNEMSGGLSPARQAELRRARSGR